jgi:hypothetical protein
MKFPAAGNAKMTARKKPAEAGFDCHAGVLLNAHADGVS